MNGKLVRIRIKSWIIAGVLVVGATPGFLLASLSIAILGAVLMLFGAEVVLKIIWPYRSLLHREQQDGILPCRGGRNESKPRLRYYESVSKKL